VSQAWFAATDKTGKDLARDANSSELPPLTNSATNSSLASDTTPPIAPKALGGCGGGGGVGGGMSEARKTESPEAARNMPRSHCAIEAQDWPSKASNPNKRTLSSKRSHSIKRTHSNSRDSQDGAPLDPRKGAFSHPNSNLPSARALPRDLGGVARGREEREGVSGGGGGIAGKGSTRGRGDAGEGGGGAFEVGSRVKVRIT
jgi:hypothetical protein